MDVASGGALACAAPFTSMYLDQRGNVRVCCINSTRPLGNVTRTRLATLWRGPEMMALREAMARHDYSQGCDLCRPPDGVGFHPTAPARAFDHLAAQAGPWPRQLELALSNACNLECEMCFGELSSAIRSRREGLAPLPAVYGDEFFADLEAFLPHIEALKFIGGEPFLSPEAWRLWQRLDQLDRHPQCHVTTNATIRNRRVDWVLDRFPTSFTVSLDGATAASFERIRRGARFDEVVANLDCFTEVARRHGGSTSLAFCLTTESWGELPDILLFGEERGLPVGVNLVSEPARLSLWRAPASLLAEVAETWSATADQVSARLDLNRAEWRDNVAWATTAAEQALADERGTPVHLAQRSPVDIARELAAGHGGAGPVLEVELDLDDRILALHGVEDFARTGADLVGIDLLGRPFIALMSGPVIDRFGAAFTSHLEDRAARRVRLHEMTFSDGEPVSVQVATAPGVPGERNGRAFVTVRR